MDFRTFFFTGELSLYHTWYICVWLKIMLDIVYIWNNTLNPYIQSPKEKNISSVFLFFCGQQEHVITLSFMNDHIISNINYCTVCYNWKTDKSCNEHWNTFSAINSIIILIPKLPFFAPFCCVATSKSNRFYAVCAFSSLYWVRWPL